MFKDFNNPVDIYCERLDPSFWSEPLNALSNFAFILAAVFTLGLWREYAPKAKDIRLLIILTAIVGVGSFIFHTVATSGAALADIIPIVIFIHCGIAVIFYRVFKLKWLKAVFATILFLVGNIIIMRFVDRALFNGSFQYVPTFLLLFVVALICYAKRLIAGKEFLIASGCFFVSITFRSIDMRVCEELPIGVHYMWHILNAMTMYYVIKGLIKTVSGKEHLLRRKKV